MYGVDSDGRYGWQGVGKDCRKKKNLHFFFFTRTGSLADITLYEIDKIITKIVVFLGGCVSCFETRNTKDFTGRKDAR